MVAKRNPQPDHWSFLGYAGPGHSNTKLVELRKYVMDKLRERGVFLEVPAEMEERIEDRFAPDFLWADRTARPGDPRVTVPFYADVGVLVFQADALEASGRAWAPGTWDELLEWIEPSQSKDVLTRGRNLRHVFVIPDPVKEAKNFVSFIFELSWTYGWTFPALDRPADSTEALHLLDQWVRGDVFGQVVELLDRMITAGEPSGAVPNPNRGGDFHEALFSRRWFSEIYPVAPDEKTKSTFREYQFSIAQLPGIRRGGEVLPGIANVDLYSLGIVRGALAPETGWMLASSLFEPEVDIARARLKRGLPISPTLFRSQVIEDSLCAQPPAYEAGRDLFHGHASTLKAILDPLSGPKLFRRTADIPRFFDLEKLLARALPRLFEKLPVSVDTLREVRAEILEGLPKIYESKQTAG
jgi:hypothetical protein